MPLQISQFHPKKEHRSCLSRVRSGASIYLDAEAPIGDPTPDSWTRYNLLDGNKIPIPKRFKPGGVKLKVENKSAGLFVKIPEAVVVIDKKNNRFEHRYEVATKDCFDRDPSQDRVVTVSLETPDVVFFPAGTEIEAVESYEVIVRDTHTTSTSTGVDLKGLSKLLGLNLGVNLRAESLHQRDTQSTSKNLKRTKIVVPADQQVAPVRLSVTYNIGFKRCHTRDGISWTPMVDFELQVEVWCSDLITCSKKATKKQKDKLIKELKEGLRCKVKQWLGEQEQRALSILPNC